MEKTELIAQAKQFYNEAEIARLKTAIEFAINKHHGQVRKSGEEYIRHPLKVASFLVEWGMDIDSVIAGAEDVTVKDWSNPIY